MAGYRKLSSEERRERTRALQESIAGQVLEFRETEQWKQFLDFSRSFHDYSVNNKALIYSQRPDASMVAGYRAWQEKGRQVRKGEKAIRIFGVTQRKTRTRDVEDEDQEQDAARASLYFPVLSVFDISQTDPIDPDAPDPSTPVRVLTGQDRGGLYTRAEAFLNSRGWSVAREPIQQHGVQGFCRTDGSRTIVVRDSLPPAAAAKTLLHEGAHALLHAEDLELAKRLGRDVCEIEAESVAYVVAGSLGLDTSEYSIGYLAAWAGRDVEQIRHSADRVLSAANQMADGIIDAAPTVDAPEREVLTLRWNEREAVSGEAAVELVKDYLHHNAEHVLYTIGQRQDLRSLPSSYADTDVLTIFDQELYARFYLSPNAERPGPEDMMVSLRTADGREVFNDQVGRAIDGDIETVITLTRRVGGQVDFDVPAPSIHRNTAAEYQQWPRFTGSQLTGTEKAIARYRLGNQHDLYVVGYDADRQQVATWMTGTPRDRVTWIPEPQRLSEDTVVIPTEHGSPIPLRRDHRFVRPARIAELHRPTTPPRPAPETGHSMYR